MPTDRFGIPYMYPTKANGFLYEMSDNPKNDSYVDWPSEMSFPGGGVVKMSPNGPTDFGIGRHVPAFLSDNSIGGCGMDFPSTAKRGYAYKADDARDVEITCLAQFNIPSGNGFSMSACTGRHSSSGCCQSFAYMGTLEPGDSPPWMRFRKETTHPNYEDSPNSPFNHSKFGSSKITGNGKYVGLKFMRYNKPVAGGTSPQDDHVVLEYWFNPNPDNDLNDWTRVGQEEDKPGFGWTSNPGDCGGDKDQIGPWSNAQNRLKTNATSGSILFKAVSLREIDPFGSFENEPPSGGGGGTTVVRKIYWGAVTTDLLQYDDLITTINHEITEVLSDPDPSSRYQHDAYFDPSTGDEIADICDNVRGTYGDGLVLSGYWSNSDNSCVVPHVVENDQGSSTRIKNPNNGPVLKNGRIFLVYWGDQWRTRASTPTASNITSRVQNQMLGTDKEFFSKLSQYGGINTPTWGNSVINLTYPVPTGTAINVSEAPKVLVDTFNKGLLPVPDDPNEDFYIVIWPFGVDLVDSKSSFLGEHEVLKVTLTIAPQIPTCPTGQHWDSVRQLCVSDSIPPPPDGGGGGGGGTPGPTRIQGSLRLSWDINTIRGVGACTGTGSSGGTGGGGPTGTLTKLYDVVLTDEKELSDNSKFDHRKRLAEVVATSDSKLNGQIIQQLDVPLRRNNSPGGTVYARIWSSQDSPPVVIYTSPTTFSAGGLGTTMSTKTFDFSTNTKALRVGDRIGVEWIGQSDTNWVVGGYGDNETSRSIMSQYEGSSWEDKDSRDFACTMWT